MWFETLTGFAEESPDQVRANLELDGQSITSRINGKQMICGRLSTPTLGELRKQALTGQSGPGRLPVREVVGDVKQLHAKPANAGALFQAASQFNLLEMTSPAGTPEDGIGVYEYDLTQGPACAIAAGAGTIYRNYFASVRGQVGQSSDHQIDCLAELGQRLGNGQGQLWEMRNGYALSSEAGLAETCQKIAVMTESERDDLRARLRIGIQWDTQVTLAGCEHVVTQAYCSALPVAYTAHRPEAWEPFARLILEAAYEATLAAAVINSAKNGNSQVYLTTLGGGAFGNRHDWIIAAIRRGLEIFSEVPLDVAIVSFARPNPQLQEICTAGL